jgi:hypothetical protein
MRRNKGCGFGLLILGAIWVVVSLIQSQLFIWLVVLGGLGYAGWWAYKKFGGGNDFGGGKDRLYRSAQIDKLEALAANLPYTGPHTIALAKGEEVVYVLNQVGLIESRSNGSSYSGGSQGVSVRIAKGISYRVGGSKGQLTRNPESVQMVDSGTAIFTNQRVVFAGQSATREWRFDKLLNVDMGPNGVSAMISVSNRQKTSGLMATDLNELTPGLLTAVATDWFEGGIEKARRRCVDTAGAFRAIDAGDTEFNATQMANRVALENPETAGSVVAPGSAAALADVAAAKSEPSPDGLVFAPMTEDGEPFEVVGESFNAANFDQLRAMLGAQEDDTVTTDVDLIAEPFNKFSRNGNAVAVQKNGLTLGHISEDENTDFFELLKEHNGRGTCQAEIYFCPVGQTPPMNSVRLLCANPPAAKA